MCQHFYLTRLYYHFGVFHHIPLLILRNIHIHLALITFPWGKNIFKKSFMDEKKLQNGKLWNKLPSKAQIQERNLSFMNNLYKSLTHSINARQCNKTQQ